MIPLEHALAQVFATLDQVAVAVSGGVDSMTLAHLTHRHHGARARMVHAVSPAVPAEATARVRAHADRYGWTLALIDAGEFADLRYRTNPIDRCYFCKSNLYSRIAGAFAGAILSGTNTDDLGDYRPGLKAAGENGVRHPFVEAGMAKSDVRVVARALGLDDVAELPAAPCLASRIETGIHIDAADLALADEVERRVRAEFGAADVRCRITAQGVRVELGSEALERLRSPTAARRGRRWRRSSPGWVAPFLATLPIAGVAPSCATRRMTEHGIKPDWQREARVGVGEAVYCSGKTAAQIARIVALADERRHSLLLTKLDASRFAELDAGTQRRLDFDPLSRTAVLDHGVPAAVPAEVGIVCAGTSDMGVAVEAQRGLAFHGVSAMVIGDVGVAGLWRLFDRLDEIAAWRVAIVVAGMEGALFSVVAGQVPGLVIAVPTSVGYGVAAGGTAALHCALASCSPGVVVVNIDNGFGAACAALKLLRVFASTGPSGN